MTKPELLIGVADVWSQLPAGQLASRRVAERVVPVTYNDAAAKLTVTDRLSQASLTLHEDSASGTVLKAVLCRVNSSVQPAGLAIETQVQVPDFIEPEKLLAGEADQPSAVRVGLELLASDDQYVYELGQILYATDSVKWDTMVAGGTKEAVTLPHDAELANAIGINVADHMKQPTASTRTFSPVFAWGKDPREGLFAMELGRTIQLFGDYHGGNQIANTTLSVAAETQLSRLQVVLSGDGTIQSSVELDRERPAYPQLEFYTGQVATDHVTVAPAIGTDGREAPDGPYRLARMLHAVFEHTVTSRPADFLRIAQQPKLY